MCKTRINKIILVKKSVVAIANIAQGENERGEEMEYKQNIHVNSRFTTFAILSSDPNSFIH